eukprot:1141262-Pelagomonas_calceolata.AAC.5
MESDLGWIALTQSRYCERTSAKFSRRGDERRAKVLQFKSAECHRLLPSLVDEVMKGGQRPLNKILAQFFLRSSSELAALVRTTVAGEEERPGLGLIDECMLAVTPAKCMQPLASMLQPFLACPTMKLG